MKANTFHENTYMTMIDLLRWRSDHEGDRTAYIYLENGEDKESSITYRELDTRARVIAARLQELGNPGERVLLLYPSGIHYITAFFGALYAGWIAVPLYPPKPNRYDLRLQKVIENARPSAVLTTSGILPRVNETITTIHSIPVEATDTLPTSLVECWKMPSVHPDDIAFLQYTSGSTSLPKGVMVTHQNIMANEKTIQAAFGHYHREILVGWLPLFHDMGLIGNLLQPMYTGAFCVVLSPSDFLQKPVRWLQAISKYRAHTSGGPNFAYDLCVERVNIDEISALDLSSWQVAFNGAEPIRADTLEHFSRKFASVGFRSEAFFPCYGLAEATLFVTGGERGRFPTVLPVPAANNWDGEGLREGRQSLANPRRLVGSGKPGVEVRVEIVHPKTCLLSPTGAEGEIWVSGTGVTAGYWENEVATRSTFYAHCANYPGVSFLRTGDLGFFHEGELFVTGRIKDLIIIRGRNFYPQDLEFLVGQSHPVLATGGGAAFTVEVDGVEQLVIVHEVKRASRKVESEEVAQAVRQAVTDEFELAVYAVVLIRPMSLPRTSSGKVQRFLAKDGFLQGKLEVVGQSILTMNTSSIEEIPISREILRTIPPEERFSALHSFLQYLLAKRLRCQPKDLKVHQPLTALGLDSLAAFAIIDEIEIRLQLRLSASDLLSPSATLTNLSRQIMHMIDLSREDGPGGIVENVIPPVSSVSQEKLFPLSSMQKRLWFIDRLTPLSPVYNIPAAVEICGVLSLERLEKSLTRIVERHEILRTTFTASDGIPLQTVRVPEPVVIPAVDLTELTPAKQEGVLRQRVEEHLRQPFRLDRYPLFRPIIFHLGREKHLLVVSLHHIIFDAWSMECLVNELAAFYAADGDKAVLPGLPVQYADFAVWQQKGLRENRWAGQLQYWKERLVNLPRFTLPTDRPRPENPSYRGQTKYRDLPSVLSEAVIARSKDEGVTPFVTLLTLFLSLLYRASGEEDFAIGISIANRDLRELKPLIGLFVNQALVRADFSKQPNFLNLLQKTQQEILTIYQNKEIPFEVMAHEISGRPSSGHNPLFQIIFVMENTLDGPVKEGGEVKFAMTPLKVETGGSRFDSMVCVWARENGLLLSWEYATDLFSEETIDVLITGYLCLLENCLRDPQTSVARLPMPEEFTRCFAGKGRFSSEGGEERKNPVERELKISIAATFTAEPVEKWLQFWAKKLNLPIKVQFAGYNQVFQAMVHAEGLFRSGESGLRVILLRLEDWARFPEQKVDGDGVSGEILKENVRYFLQTLAEATEGSTAPTLICLCPATPETLADPVRRDLLVNAEKMLCETLPSLSGVYTLTGQEIFHYYPVKEYYDPQTDQWGHVPYTDGFFSALGTMMMRKISVFRRKPYKVIVLDCDQTLWKGICGEDGPQGVIVDPYRRMLQQFMIEQYGNGILLCLCSKNNEPDVFPIFDSHDGMLLRREHLAAWRINWKPKSENLHSLAGELNLGLESFIFIDDSPMECAEVRAHCPEVLTLQLPEQEEHIPRFLQHVWAFDQVRPSGTSANRTKFYQLNREREELRNRAVDFEEFLEKLKLKLEFQELTLESLPRVAELVMRTNQFNSTVIRWSEGEIRSRCLAEGHEMECLTVSVSDRFGDYGLVGVIVFQPGETDLRVEGLILSCRAMGRRVEHRMIARLVEEACHRSLSHLTIRYVPSDKNHPIRDFLESIGEKYETPTGPECYYRIIVT